MKRNYIAAVIAAGVFVAASGVWAAPAAPPMPEPVGIALLRIEYKKALVQQENAPKVTDLRMKKLQILQKERKEDEAAEAEVDVIQAQTAQALGDIAVKELDWQLKSAIKQANTPPAPPRAEQKHEEAVASADDITAAQFDLQKAQVEADGANKVAENRKRVFEGKQASHASEIQLTDAQADMIAARTNAQLLSLELEAAQMRVDAAVKSAAAERR